jgi:hypothetical protein
MPFENPKKRTHKCHLNEGESKDFKNIFIMNKCFLKNPFQKDF